MDESQDVNSPGEAAALLRGLVRACREQGEQAPDVYIGDDGVAEAVLVPVARYRRLGRELDSAALALRTVERLGDAPGPGDGISDEDLAAWVRGNGTADRP
ncbi:hypothetical protein [Streptomyces sp. NPDC001933]|uniref:hypothetical protein n=1 Tax=Streptomyces sp. NPDC001933 TaxID=3364626 RepID=UPI0036AA8799